MGHNNGHVYKTTNGTAGSPTWIRVDNADGSPLPNRYCTRIAVDPSDTQRIFVTFGGYVAGNVWRSTDGGTSWTNIGGSLPGVPVRSVVIHPTKSNYISIGTEVGVFASVDGGDIWSPTNLGPTSCSANELFFMNTTLVAVTHGRGLFKIDVDGTSPARKRWGFAWAHGFVMVQPDIEFR